MAKGYAPSESRRSSWLALEADDDIHALDVVGVIAGLVAYVRALIRHHVR